MGGDGGRAMEGELFERVSRSRGMVVGCWRCTGMVSGMVDVSLMVGEMVEVERNGWRSSRRRSGLVGAIVDVEGEW